MFLAAFHFTEQEKILFWGDESSAMLAAGLTYSTFP